MVYYGLGYLTKPEFKSSNSLDNYIFTYHHLLNPIFLLIWLGTLSVFAIFVFYQNWKVSQHLLAFTMLIPGARADNLDIVQHHLVLFTITIIIFALIIISLLILCCGLYCKNRTAKRSTKTHRINDQLPIYNFSTDEPIRELDKNDILAGYITIH